MKKVRQYRSRQGRSDAQYTSNMKLVFISFLCLLLAFITILAYNI